MIFEARKDGKGRLERLLVAVIGLDKLVGVLEYDVGFASYPVGKWKRAMDHLGMIGGLGIVFENLPIGRDSKRKKEQLFVYRMYRANKRITRFAKSAAIADLMTMEGFTHQFNLRNIERMCVSYAPAKKNKKGA